MRVVQLVAADRWTGAAATALQLAEALRGAGVDCTFAFRPGHNLEKRLANVEWCLPILAKERTAGDVCRALARVRAATAGADVVHVHLPHDHLLARLALGRRNDVRLVRSVHNDKHLRGDLYHRFLFRRVAGIGLAHSEMAAPAARLVDPCRVPTRVLPLALESRFHPSGKRLTTRRRLGVSDDAAVVGTIGKIDRGRGFEIFIRALAAAPGVVGVIVGDGPARGDLQRLAAELHVAERLIWAGYLEDGLEEIYAAMDLFIFPAAGSDHAHRAIAEAAGCGLPALAAALPGVADLIDPGRTGDLFPAGDSAALAALIVAWTGDQAWCAQAGEAAAKRAATLWTPAALAAAALGLYRDAGVRGAADGLAR